jgi:hypothetical protein
MTEPWWDTHFLWCAHNVISKDFFTLVLLVIQINKDCSYVDYEPIHDWFIVDSPREEGDYVSYLSQWQNPRCRCFGRTDQKSRK